mmetsp:Transcript_31824/g.73182  ORF Transcript_31824/g.73182 Transcript_31824/m.73182 type:complete len:350 (-) Transcript_31824:1140-2189(-)
MCSFVSSSQIGQIQGHGKHRQSHHRKPDDGQHPAGGIHLIHLVETRHLHVTLRQGHQQPVNERQIRTPHHPRNAQHRQTQPRNEALRAPPEQRQHDPSSVGVSQRQGGVSAEQDPHESHYGHGMQGESRVGIGGPQGSPVDVVHKSSRQGALAEEGDGERGKEGPVGGEGQGHSEDQEDYGEGHSDKGANEGKVEEGLAVGRGGLEGGDEAPGAQGEGGEEPGWIQLELLGFGHDELGNFVGGRDGQDAHEGRHGQLQKPIQIEIVGSLLLLYPLCNLIVVPKSPDGIDPGRQQPQRGDERQCRLVVAWGNGRLGHQQHRGVGLPHLDHVLVSGRRIVDVEDGQFFMKA